MYSRLCYLSGTTGKTYRIVKGDARDDGSDDDMPNDHDVYAPVYITMVDLMKGAYNIVYAHPEALLNNRTIDKMLRSRVYRKNVCAVVIDEVHMISEW
jgi:hypothetical protein